MSAGGSRSRLVVAGLVLGLGGCSLLAPATDYDYTLVTISGQPLPATVIHAQTTDGDVFEVRVERGRVRFLAASVYLQDLVARHVRNGVLADTVFDVRVSGRYERKDVVVTVRYRDPIVAQLPIPGQLATRIYELEDGDRLLRGGEFFVGFRPGTYEYVRK